MEGAGEGVTEHEALIEFVLLVGAHALHRLDRPIDVDEENRLAGHRGHQHRARWKIGLGSHSDDQWLTHQATGSDGRT